MNKAESKGKRKSRKGLYAGVAVALLVLVIVAIGLYLFLQSPERRLAKGFSNLVTAGSIGVDGVIENKTPMGSFVFTIDAVTNKKQAQADVGVNLKVGESGEASTNIEVIVPEDGVMYAKVNEPKTVMSELSESFFTSLYSDTPGLVLSEELRTTLLAQIKASLDESAEQIDGNWIKISQEQLRVTTGDAEANTDCYVEFARELDTNSRARNSLASAYMKYQFIIIDDSLESEGTSQGYRVSIDQAKLKEFKDSVSDNEAVKKLDGCGLDILTLGASDDLNDRSVDIWVDRFSNNITRIAYEHTENEESSSNVNLELEYGVNVDVQQPSKSINLLDAMPSFFVAR